MKSRMPPKEQYVPCKDGNCNVSTEFKAVDGSTIHFKDDLETLSIDKEVMGKEIEERRCPDYLQLLKKCSCNLLFYLKILCLLRGHVQNRLSVQNGQMWHTTQLLHPKLFSQGKLA